MGGIGRRCPSGGSTEAGGATRSQKDSPLTFLKRVVLASLSASVAESATFPIDIVKTRLQLQGQPQLSSQHRCDKGVRSAFGVVVDIWRSGAGHGSVVTPGGLRLYGLLGFYSGLSPAVLRHLIYTPIRIVGYEQLRSGGVASPAESLLGKALCGGVSGVIAQVIASPADLIKVRMQADGRLVSQHLQPRYSGIVDALMKITRADGFKGLWAGVLPNAQRAFLVNMGELACYDHAKRVVIRNRISEDNIYAHTLASVASGLCATTLSCPADVVKTRTMNQASSSSTGQETMTMYRNSLDCLVKTVRNEGASALWKGFFPTWARLGPWQFVFWVSYEKFRSFAGLSSF